MVCTTVVQSLLVLVTTTARAKTRCTVASMECGSGDFSNSNINAHLRSFDNSSGCSQELVLKYWNAVADSKNMNQAVGSVLG